MRKQEVRMLLGEMGTRLVLIIMIFFYAAPSYFLEKSMVFLLRWLTRTPKLVLREKEDMDTSEAHWLKPEIERLLPPGRALVRAENVLKRNGFTIRSERHSLSAVKHKPYLRYLFLAWWEWRLTLDLKDGCITVVTASSRGGVI